MPIQEAEYDTIRKKSLTWTQKPSDQLNLAHIARKKYEKEEDRTKHASAHLIQYRFKIHLLCYKSQPFNLPIIFQFF